MTVKIGPEIKVLVWDFDGTVINSFGIFFEITQTLAPQFGKPVPSQEVARKNYHGTLRDSIHSVFGGGMPDEELDAATLAFVETQHSYYEEIDDHLIDDAIRLSNRALRKGLKQAIVTNRYHEGHGKASPREIVANTVLQDSIHAVLCGDDGQYRKPDPRVLADYLRSENLIAEKLLIIGDQFVDVQFAMNLHAQGILVMRDRDELVNSHLLEDGWQKYVSIVKSLDEVVLL